MFPSINVSLPTSPETEFPSSHETDARSKSTFRSDAPLLAPPSPPAAHLRDRANRGRALEPLGVRRLRQAGDATPLHSGWNTDDEQGYAASADITPPYGTPRPQGSILQRKYREETGIGQGPSQSAIEHTHAAEVLGAASESGSDAYSAIQKVVWDAMDHITSERYPDIKEFETMFELNKKYPAIAPSNIDQPAPGHAADSIATPAGDGLEERPELANPIHHAIQKSVLSVISRSPDIDKLEAMSAVGGNLNGEFEQAILEALERYPHIEEFEAMIELNKKYPAIKPSNIDQSALSKATQSTGNPAGHEEIATTEDERERRARVRMFQRSILLAVAASKIEEF